MEIIAIILMIWIIFTFIVYVDEYGHKKWFKEAARKRFVVD